VDRRDVEQIWRDGLRALAPTAVEGSATRVARRVAFRRRRRALVGSGAATATIVIGTGAYVVASRESTPTVVVDRPPRESTTSASTGPSTSRAVRGPVSATAEPTTPSSPITTVPASGTPATTPNTGPTPGPTISSPPTTNGGPPPFTTGFKFNGAIAGAPVIAVVLDDGGVHIAPNHVAGGAYNVAFTDARSNRHAADAVVFHVYITGPRIVVLSVRAGTTGGSQLCPGAISSLVTLNGSPLAAGGDFLEVDDGGDCTTPVT
jgi:hypothetical protein